MIPHLPTSLRRAFCGRAWRTTLSRICLAGKSRSRLIVSKHGPGKVLCSEPAELNAYTVSLQGHLLSVWLMKASSMPSASSMLRPKGVLLAHRMVMRAPRVVLHTKQRLDPGFAPLARPPYGRVVCRWPISPSARRTSTH